LGCKLFVMASSDSAALQRQLIDTLVSGSVQSFVDLFYLSHRPAPRIELPGGAKATDHITEDMELVRTQLMAAEAGRRRGDTDGVIAAYSAAAAHYVERAAFDIGVYFYERCLGAYDSG
jgi:hypothetical protein